jgi:hypothetical protein
MFTEDELRTIRKQFKSVEYIRTLTTNEEKLLLKITKLIREVHFHGKAKERA